MSFVPCSIDGERCREKPATVYWAWYTGNADRQAYRARLCVAHFVQEVVPLQVHCEDSWSTCPGCGKVPGDELDPVYATVFVPGQPREDLEMAFCATCAAFLRVKLVNCCEKLPDRDEGPAAEAPRPSSREVWKALGRG